MTSVEADDRAHHRRRFRGRDPHEGQRTATPLELLYDLTLVVAFGVAADELAHYVVMVAGYVVMRVALLVLWAQVARHDPARRARTSPRSACRRPAGSYSRSSTSQS